MDIEHDHQNENDNKTFSFVEEQRQTAKIFNAKHSSVMAPENSLAILQFPKNSISVQLDFGERPYSQQNILIKSLKDDKSFLSGQSRLSNNGAIISPQPQSNNEQRIFMTPPKRPKNDVNEELTKKDYRERKQIRPEEDLASRFDSDYEVLGTLGTGYFGMVKKCRNKIDGAVYAIKIMGCNDRKNLNEVKAMAILSNKECSNIVRYHHSWIENRKLYMVMQYCESSLRQSLEDKKKLKKHYAESQIRIILYGILKALCELHQHHVVHLDIKPQNVLKTFGGKYKLGDLGLCRLSKLECGEEINQGDSRYMSREILNNFNANEVPDLTKADIFSLGMTLYELISLEDLPYNGEHWHQIRDGGIQQSLDKLSKIYSRQLVKIVKNMTEPKFIFRGSSFEIIRKRYFLEQNTKSKNLREPFQRHFSI